MFVTSGVFDSSGGVGVFGRGTVDWVVMFLNVLHAEHQEDTDRCFVSAKVVERPARNRGYFYHAPATFLGNVGFWIFRANVNVAILRAFMQT